MLGAAVVAGVIAIAATPAQAVKLYDSNTQWFQTSGSGYYASMTINTDTSYSNSNKNIRLASASSSGGVYYYGPYGDTPQTATDLVQTWTVSVNGSSAVACSVGYPSGASCSISSDSRTLTATDSTDFNASKPTSTSLPATNFLDNTGFNYIQIQSNWKASFKINGTTVVRNVGENNYHHA
ncbi:hypothetical protein Ari01nite_35100 [Paractinoplanes rishiriensis]|uniref:Uncharacterized protein n=2 Tax=Paractinoplanes rishiriensis TaxID=1050105 RepID=A0A919JWD1_9ACTN|nr:hypothetical protein Ari01nite_35100 [Actinoplanes rishiriensis]